MALLVTGALVSCGKGAGNSGGTGGTFSFDDAGPTGPTSLVVTWTLAGSAATSATCMAHGAEQIYINVSATTDPTEHQTMTVPCSMGTITFPSLMVQQLGNPYVEGTLLDAMGTTVAIVGTNVMGALGTTNATLAFFGPSGSGGAASSSSSAAQASSSSSGNGGNGGAPGSSAASTSTSTSGPSSTAASSSSSSSSSVAASSSSTSGSTDAGAD